MLRDFSVTITATGVAQRLTTSGRTIGAWITLQTLKDVAGAEANTAPIAIGGSDVALNKGFVMAAGDSAVTWPVSDINGYDLAEIWVIGTINNGVQGVYFTR